MFFRSQVKSVVKANVISVKSTSDHDTARPDHEKTKSLPLCSNGLLGYIAIVAVATLFVMFIAVYEDAASLATPDDLDKPTIQPQQHPITSTIIRYPALA